MSISEALSNLASSVRADFASTQRYRLKYHADHIKGSHLPSALVTRIGFQMLAGVRVMQALSAAKVPLLPQVVSRLIRHAYGAEIHWGAKIAPGISFVHGNGIVISKDATISPGCILFQNVTLGQGIDPVTREIGGPTLGVDVHVGPGAVILGPIHIGDGSKIMAGVVVTQSVPSRSVVRSPTPEVVARGSVGTDAAES